MTKINLDEFFSSIVAERTPPAPDPPDTQNTPSTPHTHDTPNTPKEERFIEMFRMYEESRKQSELLRSRINRGINNKESHTELLLLSLECIALITGDLHFYKENSKKIAADKER
jgi:hypothetical protein